MNKRTVFNVLAFLLITLCFVLPVFAFDANDYDSGSSSDDYSSSSDDYSSSSDDYSSSRDDWSSSNYSGDYGDDSEVSTWGIILGIILIIIFGGGKSLLFGKICGICKKTGNKAPAAQGGIVRPGAREGLGIQLPDRTTEIENIIKGNDPNFSAADFVSFVKRLYIDIQTAWCKRDMTPMRALLHDNLYDTTVKQIQAKIDQGVIYHYESMVVNTAYLTSYAKDRQCECLTLYLNARMIDWQEDQKTGKILRGDKTTRWDLRYKMKFMQSSGVLTREETAGVTGHNCPNRGAPLELASSAKCTHCDSVITTGQYNWVLSDFGTIRNDTIDEGVKTD